MVETDDLDDAETSRDQYHLSNDERIYLFLMGNLLYQELRPGIAKDADALDAVIARLASDPLCPIKALSQSTIQRALRSARGRRTPGQWHFKRIVDPVSGTEKVVVSEGRRIKYPHPAAFRKKT